MASVFTHPLVPLVLVAVVGSNKVSWPLLCAGVVASVLPDVDAMAFRLGIPYSDPLGHRGFTHSFAFSLLVAAAVMPLAPQLRSQRAVTFAFLFASMASHGILDAFTAEGLGIEFFWPFSEDRYFFPFHPVESSPVSITRFIRLRAGDVLLSEFIWLWLPLLTIGLVGYGARRLVSHPIRSVS